MMQYILYIYWHLREKKKKKNIIAVTTPRSMRKKAKHLKEAFNKKITWFLSFRITKEDQFFDL